MHELDDPLKVDISKLIENPGWQPPQGVVFNTGPYGTIRIFFDKLQTWLDPNCTQLVIGLSLAMLAFFVDGNSKMAANT